MVGEAGAVLELVDTLDVPTLFVLCALGFWRIVKALHAIELRMTNHSANMERVTEILDRHIIADAKADERLTKTLDRLTARIDSQVSRAS